MPRQGGRSRRGRARAGLLLPWRHAGHGLGISHPEAPFLVRESLETLLAGDVVTLEPGLYVDGIGGVRIEHNYLVTEMGYERLESARDRVVLTRRASKGKGSAGSLASASG